MINLIKIVTFSITEIKNERKRKNANIS